mmetsp:Transcript_81/g.127  ORF Transcript_81/g.127 Transcript_81/m.127 type:complete len:247 (+) Transcript_81:1729-2469(+)
MTSSSAPPTSTYYRPEKTSKTPSTVSRRLSTKIPTTTRRVSRSRASHRAREFTRARSRAPSNVPSLARLGTIARNPPVRSVSLRVCLTPHPSFTSIMMSLTMTTMDYRQCRSGRERCVSSLERRCSIPPTLNASERSISLDLVVRASSSHALTLTPTPTRRMTTRNVTGRSKRRWRRTREANSQMPNDSPETSSTTSIVPRRRRPPRGSYSHRFYSHALRATAIKIPKKKRARFWQRFRSTMRRRA